MVVLVASGLGNDEIAAQMSVSPFTVKTHAVRAMTKVGARDRAQLVSFVFRAASAPEPAGQTPKQVAAVAMPSSPAGGTAWARTWKTSPSRCASGVPGPVPAGQGLRQGKADEFGVGQQWRPSPLRVPPVSSSIFTCSAVKRVFRSCVTTWS